jgi:hypothetical protein
MIHALRPRIGKEIKGVGVLYLLSPKKISFSIENEKSLYRDFSIQMEFSLHPSMDEV